MNIRYALVFAGLLFLQTGYTAERPRLVVQITVDQLRGDRIPRFKEEFGTGGFRRLLDHGVYFANAHYTTANTLTAAGHAVLVTGADTAEHGIVGNDWFDRETQQTVYCTADSRYPVLSDPDNAARGMSPANLLSSTIGDELFLASARQSKVFAVSGKDRSSIIPAGHLGKALWLGGAGGLFTSSTYYYTALPDWVKAWNAGNPQDRYRKATWTPMRDPSTYRNVSARENVNATPKESIGRTFPHKLETSSDSKFFTMLRFTPFLDELTAAFARELITREKLGDDATTDYLSISFSANDYVGHAYGPESIEAQDNLLRLDATLAELLAFIDKQVGLSRTLIVLSADHGADDIPEDRKAMGYAADRVDPDALLARGIAALQKRFGTTDNLITAFVPPGFYLDRAKIAALKLDQATVESALAEELRSAPGIAYALTRTDLMAGRIPRTALMDRVMRGFQAARSGDVTIVQSQYWYLDGELHYYASMHGSPYSYDTFVPILVSGMSLKPAINYEAVAPSQIAPTLSAVLGIKPPSGCSCSAPLPTILQ